MERIVLTLIGVLDNDLKAGSGVEGQTTYCQSKFVQLLGAHWWRRQLAGKCTVIAVSPGLIPATGIGRGSSMVLSTDMPDAKTVPEGKLRGVLSPDGQNAYLDVTGAASIHQAFTRDDLPEDPEQIFLTSWGEWWDKDVYGPSLDKALQDKWCLSKDEIEQEELSG
jgi:hypothetical protein